MFFFWLFFYNFFCCLYLFVSFFIYTFYFSFFIYVWVLRPSLKPQNNPVFSILKSKCHNVLCHVCWELRQHLQLDFVAEKGAFDPALDPRSGWFSDLADSESDPGTERYAQPPRWRKWGAIHKEIITELQSFSISLFNALRGAEPKDAGVYSYMTDLRISLWGKMRPFQLALNALWIYYNFFSLSPCF